MFDSKAGQIKICGVIDVKGVQSLCKHRINSLLLAVKNNKNNP